MWLDLLKTETMVISVWALVTSLYGSVLASIISQLTTVKLTTTFRTFLLKIILTVNGTISTTLTSVRVILVLLEPLFSSQFLIKWELLLMQESKHHWKTTLISLWKKSSVILTSTDTSQRSNSVWARKLSSELKMNFYPIYQQLKYQPREFQITLVEHYQLTTNPNKWIETNKLSPQLT